MKIGGVLLFGLMASCGDDSRPAVAGAIAASPEGHRAMWSTRTLLPIVDLDVTAHEPVTSAGACALLSQTEAIRVMEGGLEVLFSREILRAEAWR